MIHLHCTFSSSFGDFTIIWKEIEGKIRIQRMFVSDKKLSAEEKTLGFFPDSEPSSAALINKQGKHIQRFLSGEEVKFDLSVLDFDRCSEVQKKVLIAEYNIPRGWISTYKRIANHIGLKNGARVVGNSLARNPFPIFIPCHRVIKSNGELGGYQGGLAMKRALLELEGIKFSEKGKVISTSIHY